VRRLSVLLFAALACRAALAGDPAVLLRDTELRGQPYSDAAVVVTLPAKQAVILEERRGGWYRAGVDGKTGWLRMTSVRILGAARGKQGDSGVAEALGLATTGRSGASGVTVATGIRGLDEAAMANATPDYDAVARLDQLAVSENVAQRFAARGKLQGQQIAYSERGDSEGIGAPQGKEGAKGGDSDNSDSGSRPFGGLSW